VEKYLNELPKDHVIRTFYKEHFDIFGYLDELEEIKIKISKMRSPVDEPELFERLIFITKAMQKTETHYLREEMLFSELEKLGIHQYHHVLKSEHQFLRTYKDEFLTLIHDIDKIDFASFKTQLNFMANGIIGILREHSYRENNIIFPMALSVITENSEWKRLKKLADEIGYVDIGYIKKVS
jgi:hypothetical protein